MHFTAKQIQRIKTKRKTTKKHDNEIWLGLQVVGLPRGDNKVRLRNFFVLLCLESVFVVVPMASFIIVDLEAGPPERCPHGLPLNE